MRKVIVIALLALICVGMLMGCSNTISQNTHQTEVQPKELTISELTGTWAAEIHIEDMQNMLTAMGADSNIILKMVAFVLDTANSEDLVCQVHYTFGEDGICVNASPKTSYIEFNMGVISAFLAHLENGGLYEYMEIATDMTPEEVDAALKEQNMTQEELLASITESFENSLKEMEQEREESINEKEYIVGQTYTYTLEGNRIYVEADPEVDSSGYVEVSYNGKTITVERTHNTTENLPNSCVGLLIPGIQMTKISEDANLFE